MRRVWVPEILAPLFRKFWHQGLRGSGVRFSPFCGGDGCGSWAPELDVATAFEDAVEEGLGQVGIMEDVSPGGKGLVGGEEHGFSGGSVR
jgi:hypothetical protein